MKILLSFICLLFFAVTASGQSVVNFSENLKKICTSANDILAKKIYLTILKDEKKASDPCSNLALIHLIQGCGKGKGCDDILVIYHESIYRHEGKVLGQ